MVLKMFPSYVYIATTKQQKKIVNIQTSKLSLLTESNLDIDDDDHHHEQTRCLFDHYR